MDVGSLVDDSTMKNDDIRHVNRMTYSSASWLPFSMRSWSSSASIEVSIVALRRIEVPNSLETDV